VSEFSEIKVAQVDCVANADLCSAQNIHSYPTIRLYPVGSKGLNTVAMYNGNRDLVSMKSWLLSLLPSPVISLNGDQFREQILNKRFVTPWLVEFYASWCGHCTHFEPEFRKVAHRLEGEVKTAKIDCGEERFFCGKLSVNSYPTVFLYLDSDEKYEISSQDPTEIVSRVKQLVNDKHYEHDEL
jgi:DnaJ family protein C protein 10